MRGIVALPIVSLLLLGFATAETLGWPFLARPLSSYLTRKLDRTVSFEPGVPASSTPSNTFTEARADKVDSFRIHFFGRIRISADALRIGAPAWSKAPFTVSARQLTLELRYPDLWRFFSGDQLHIENLQAASLDAHIERLADGRASWQIDSSSGNPSASTATDLALPHLNNAPITRGNLKFRDALYGSHIDAVWSLSDSLSGIRPNGQAAVDADSVATGKKRAFLLIDATGHYRKLPLEIAIKSSADWLPNSGEGPQSRIDWQAVATLGRAKLLFNGSSRDPLRLDSFNGRYVLTGPSLAAVGEPLGVTLPSTPAFRIEGVLVKAGDVWQTVVEHALVGSSHLNGAFSYKPGGTQSAGTRAHLAGRLNGSRLLLADLGPAIGGKEGAKNGSNGSTRVLPDRKFDLRVLRAMDANVLVDIREVNLNTELLEPLRPLSAHLQLSNGVLTLNNIDARTADGNLRGKMELDGRGTLARLDTDFRWDAVRLERWIRQKRAPGLPPYVSGQLGGRATLKGQGQSTAEILSTLNGRARTELQNGSVSHLAIEASGLDIAEAVGLLFKGDTALKVQCAVADMNVARGLFKPRVMVFDTIDSVVSIDGALSLANESLDLRLVVLPKDFSPVTLRSPLHVRGSFARPDVYIEKQALSLKVASTLLLGLLNPLAALLPLIDAGDAAEAQDISAGCRKLMQHRPANKAKSIR